MARKGILGKKVGMTQVFTDNGELVPVTVVDVTPNVVMQVKTVESDGYEAVQLGYGDMREVLTNKPSVGHAKKADTTPKRFVREIRDVALSDYEIGSEVKADEFAAGDIVDVTGTSKGHGYQGNIKKDGQSRGPMAHGSKYHRGVGSLSANSDPSRVFKNKHMAGQWGHEHVTVQNLEVVRVDGERNLLFVKGALPGPNGGLLMIRDSVKA